MGNTEKIISGHWNGKPQESKRLSTIKIINPREGKHLYCVDNKIIWIVGHRNDDRLKNPKTPSNFTNGASIETSNPIASFYQNLMAKGF
jgi:hypothetical protein